MFDPNSIFQFPSPPNNLELAPLQRTGPGAVREPPGRCRHEPRRGSPIDRTIAADRLDLLSHLRDVVVGLLPPLFLDASQLGSPAGAFLPQRAGPVLFQSEADRPLAGSHPGPGRLAVPCAWPGSAAGGGQVHVVDHVGGYRPTLVQPGIDHRGDYRHGIGIGEH